MMSILLILAGLLFLECETTAAVETYTYTNVGQNDKVFTEDVLFESPARNPLNCARQCNQHESCVTFTIDQGICRGHAVLVTSNTTAVAAPGAQSFAKSNYITKAIRPRDCVEVKHSKHESGVVTIYPEDNSPLKVYCDQDTDGGGWLVFQRRQDGSVDFFRNWTEYQTGFGDLLGEFWLGLDALHLLTSRQRYELRVDLMSFEGTEGNITYSNFNISDSSDGYRLGFDNFTGGSACT
ncbi:ficolin-2-like [Littorina saxatilis]|uniref:ficolin-2-like n=1 Tax=Littorina saxatilis TaxID=31220 RepID=UPI0038B46AE1